MLPLPPLSNPPLIQHQEHGHRLALLQLIQFVCILCRWVYLVGFDSVACIWVFFLVVTFAAFGCCYRNGAPNNHVHSFVVRTVSRGMFFAAGLVPMIHNPVQAMTQKQTGSFVAFATVFDYMLALTDYMVDISYTESMAKIVWMTVFVLNSQNDSIRPIDKCMFVLGKVLVAAVIYRADRAARMGVGKNEHNGRAPETSTPVRSWLARSLTKRASALMESRLVQIFTGGNGIWQTHYLAIFVLAQVMRFGGGCMVGGWRF